MLRPKIVVVGAGPHAKVILDLLEQNDEYTIVGCTDPHPMASELLGYSILGGDERLPQLKADGVGHAFPAVGDNSIRSRLLKVLRRIGFALPNVVSQDAVVSPRAFVGHGVAIMPGAVLNVDTIVGNGTIVNTGATVDHDCRIGDCAHIAPGCHLGGGVSIGEGVLLGIGTCVIPNISIGAWSAVGAGGVVVRDIPAGAKARGIPARIVG